MALNSALKEYDPSQVIITWSGIPLNAGIIAGTFVRVRRNVKMWKLHKGGDGEGARVRTSNHSGLIEVTTRNGSEIHQILSIAANTDAITGAVVAPLLLMDFSGNTLHAASRAFIQDPAPDAFSSEESSRTWVFEADSLFMFLGGSRDVRASAAPVGFAGLTTTF